MHCELFKGGVVCKVLIELLQPKLEHLVKEHSMEWVAVVSSLEAMMTVQNLLIALETPENWWKSILPKLQAMKSGPATLATPATPATPPTTPRTTTDLGSPQPLRSPRRAILLV